LLRGVFRKFLGGPRLADSGLSGNHDAASASRERLFQRRAQHPQLIPSADEGFFPTSDEAFDRRLYDNLPTAKSAPKLPRLGQSRKVEAISTNPQAAQAPSRLTKLSIAPNTPGATRSQGGHHAPVFDRANLRRSRAHG
jgi:hypothetical protein